EKLKASSVLLSPTYALTENESLLPLTNAMGTSTASLFYVAARPFCLEIGTLASGDKNLAGSSPTNGHAGTMINAGTLGNQQRCGRAALLTYGLPTIFAHPIHLQS